jgi:hypothetical protein
MHSKSTQKRPVGRRRTAREDRNGEGRGEKDVQNREANMEDVDIQKKSPRDRMNAAK